MKNMKLDQEERVILASFERGEWKPVKNLRAEIARHRGYARNTLRKDKRVNIRVSSQDLQGVQKRALEEGIPYQTLIASLIHKYVSGGLVERRA